MCAGLHTMCVRMHTYVNALCMHVKVYVAACVRRHLHAHLQPRAYVCIRARGPFRLYIHGDVTKHYSNSGITAVFWSRQAKFHPSPQRRPASRFVPVGAAAMAIIRGTRGTCKMVDMLSPKH